jgi:hypothetical protein
MYCVIPAAGCDREGDEKSHFRTWIPKTPPPPPALAIASYHETGRRRLSSQ